MMTLTLIKFCSLYVRKLDKEELKLFLHSSPHYPNLLSVMQTLLHVGIKANAVRCDQEGLTKLPSPLLLHLKDGDEEKLVLVKNHAGKSIKIYSTHTDKWVVKELLEIKDSWDGIAIYSEQKSLPHINNMVSVMACGVILALTVVLIVFAQKTTDLLFLTPSLVGLIISYSLYDRKPYNLKTISKLCHLSGFTDCTRVSRSEYGQILGFKLNSLAMAYFLSQLIISLGSIVLIGCYPIVRLYGISLLMIIPISAYSVYGQIAVRKICPLCLIILLCIGVQGAISLANNCEVVSFETGMVWLLVYSFCLSVIYVYGQVTKLKAENSYNLLRLIKLLRLKETIRSKSTPLEELSSPISIGDKGTHPHVTTIITLNCSHCKQMVKNFIGLIDKGVKFQWDIVVCEVSAQDSYLLDQWVHLYHVDQSIFLKRLSKWSHEKGRSVYTFKEHSPSISTEHTRSEFRASPSKHKYSSYPQIVFNNRLLSSLYDYNTACLLIEDQAL